MEKGAAIGHESALSSMNVIYNRMHMNMYKCCINGVTNLGTGGHV